MFDVTMNTTREGSFDAEVTTREYSEEHTDGMPIARKEFVLHLHSDPEVETPFHRNRSTVTMTRAQAEQVYAAFTRAFTKHDGI